jgi:hypothetical protein
MIEASLRYLDAQYGADEKKRFRESLPAPLRDKLPSIKTVSWYPMEDVAALFRGFVMLHEGDDEKAYAALRGVGRSICEGALNTYMRLLLRFMTVRLFADRIPSFWARDHRGGTLTIESFDSAKRVVVARHGDIDGYSYVAGVAPGFLKAGFSALGLKNVRTSTHRFSLKEPAPKEVTYTISWD